MKPGIKAQAFLFAILLLVVIGASQIHDTDAAPYQSYAPPVARFTYAIDGATVAFNASDSYAIDGSIVNYTWHFGDGSIGYGMTVSHTYSGGGTYAAILTVTDDNGKSNRSTASVEVDLSAPSTTIKLSPTTPNGQYGWYVSSVTVTLTATDDMSGVNTTYYAIDYALQQKYTGPFSLVGTGQHNLSYYSVDNAGNQEQRHYVTITIDRDVPTTTHLINGSSPTETGWYTGSVQLSLSASDGPRDASGVDETLYRIIGEKRSFQPYTKPLNRTAEGKHTVQYFSRDVAGNAEPLQNITIPIDRTAPDLSIDVPQQSYLYFMGREMFPLSGAGDTAVVVGPLTVQATAIDGASGVGNVSFYVDGTLRGTDNMTPYTWKWNENTAGASTITVKAADKAGHTASIEVPVIAFIRQ